MKGEAIVNTCVAAGCDVKTYWDEPEAKCADCVEGCDKCENKVTCLLCSDTSAYC